MHVLQKQSGFHFFTDFLKSDKVTIFIVLQGIEFQVTEPKYLIEFVPKYSVLIFGTTRSDFDHGCVDILFITNILLKTSDVRPCLTLNISIANC